MVTWILLIITIIACAFARYCLFLSNTFKKGFILLAKTAYNPKTQSDIDRIIYKLEHELTRTEKTNNGQES